MDHPSGEGFSWDLGGAFPPPRDLEEVVEGYGVRYATVARIGELGFTAATLVGMTEAELDDMMATLSHLFRWDLLLGERYGLKAALRAERRRIHGTVLQQIHHHHVLPPGGDDGRRRHLALTSDNGAPPPPGQHYYPAANAVLDTLSQEGLSEEPVQQEREAAGSGGELAAAGAVVRAKSRSSTKKKPTKKRTANRKKRRSKSEHDPEGGGHHEERDQDDDDEEEDEAEEGGWGSEESSGTCGLGGGGEKQREHPFIVTEPGEVARAKKNGLDYLFHLYEQCRLFLIQVQSMAKEQGHKCPTKVTNQVFRYAKKVGASYINKPKMRHYVHCYALHCLDEEASNALRRAFKERGENVGAWRQACYKPLVAISARHAWDIDAVFNAHPRLAIWYVPTKLRQLCHFARSNAAAAAAVNGAVLGGDGMPPPPPPPPPPPMF